MRNAVLVHFIYSTVTKLITIKLVNKIMRFKSADESTGEKMRMLLVFYDVEVISKSVHCELKIEGRKTGYEND